jgi:hypothetical protein
MTKIIPFTPPGKYHHPCASENELRALARGGALRLSQIASLMQGFLPRGRASDENFQYLADYADVVARLKGAIEQGALQLPATPRELVAVADRLQLCLPQPFTDQVVCDTPPDRRAVLQIPPTEELVHPPRRPGRPRRGELTSTSNRPVSQRATKFQGRDTDVTALAKKLALEYVRRTGVMPYAHTLVKDLVATLNWAPSTVQRAFSVKNLLSKAEFRNAKRYWCGYEQL